jgi:DNA-directed RNA polymerase subunit RPC12/RpoP
MLTSVQLQEVKPAVVVCPTCSRRLMVVKDVRWGATNLEFLYECADCGTELSQEVAKNKPSLAPSPAAVEEKPVAAALAPPPFEQPVSAKAEKVRAFTERRVAKREVKANDGPPISRGTAALRGLIFDL